MKIKYVTAAIILALACTMVVETFGQTHRGPRRVKAVPKAPQEQTYAFARDGRTYSTVSSSTRYDEASNVAAFAFKVTFDLETPAGRSAQNTAQYLARSYAIYPDQIYAIQAVEYVCLVSGKENKIVYVFMEWTDGKGNAIAKAPIDREHPYIKPRSNEVKDIDHAIFRTQTDPDVEAVFTMAALILYHQIREDKKK